LPRKFTCLALLAVAISSSVYAKCERNEYGVYEENTCAYEAQEKADKQLNVVYRDLMSVQDEEGKKKLKAAQMAWIKYRDAELTFVYSVESGSIGQLVAANQHERITRERTKILSDWLKNTNWNR